MPIVPGRTLLLAAALPVLLAFSAIANPDLFELTLLVDAAIVLLALADALFVVRPGVSIQRTLPDTASLARPVRVDLRIKNETRRRLKVRVNDSMFEDGHTEELPLEVELGGQVTRSASYRLKAMRRGPHILGDHYVRYPSPLGFWWRQLRLPAEDLLRVYPDVQAVRYYELLARQNRDVFASRATRLRGGDTEFERLRDYNRDDEFRRIDWKATARRRKFTVREYQLEKNQNVVFLVDCGRLMTAEWDNHTALDYSLNAMLMLSHVAIRRGDQVGLLAFDDRVKRFLKPAAGVSASNRIIQATYDLFPTMVESDYEAAFRALRTHIKKRTLVVFISHAIDDRTARRIQSLTRQLLPRHLPLVVLLKDRELEEAAVHAARNVEDMCIQAASSEVLFWRHKIITEMQRAGVMVLDVFHNQLTGALVTRYLETKARGLI